MDISDIHDARAKLKIFNRILLVLTLLVSYYSYVSFASRVSDKIYTTLQSDHYCSRRLNATHQMGCTSNLGGNFGIVWIIKQKSDLDHVLKTGPTPPYIAVLNREFYTRNNLLEFKANPDRVSGVIFIDGNHDDPEFRSSPFSPDDRCPNRYSGLYVNDTLYQDCKQNLWMKESPISGLLYEDIPYPIFLFNDKKSIDELQNCFNTNNVILPERSQKSYPLCGVQLDSFMLAASNSGNCLNSHSIVDELLQSNGRRCYSVENQSIFGFYRVATGPLKPIKDSTLAKPDTAEPQSVILLLAKLSSLSMFTEISPGADSTITSIVTLLAVADSLKKLRDSEQVLKSKRNIAFAILDSEPFDYTGSSKIIYSMQRNSFPHIFFRYTGSNATEAMQNINLTAIEYIVNLDQLSVYPNGDTLYLHSDPQNADTSKLDRAVEIMKRAAKDVKFEHSDPKMPLPPVSVQEFIKYSQQYPQEHRLMGLAISNYDKTYSNLVYNSIYDDIINVHRGSKQTLIDHIARVSEFIAKSIFELAFKNEASNLVVDKKLVEELFDCYLIDANCNLFTRAWQAGQHLPKGPIQTYKDPIKKSDDMNGAITEHLLAYLIGDHLKDLNLSKCYEENDRSLVYNYQFVNGNDKPVNDASSGICVRSQVQMVSALSPAFLINENSIEIDKKYPAWTVSLNSIRSPVRMYLKPSPVYQWCIFLTGVVITAISIIVVRQVTNTITVLRSEQSVSETTT